MRRHTDSLVTNRVRHFRPVEPLTPSVRNADAWRVRLENGNRIANLLSLSNRPAPETVAMCAVPSGRCVGEVAGFDPPEGDVHRTGGSRQGTAIAARGPTIARRLTVTAQHPRRHRSSCAQQRSGDSPGAVPPPLAADAHDTAHGGEDGPATVASSMRRSVRHPRRRDTHEERNAHQRPPAGGKPNRHQ